MIAFLTQGKMYAQQSSGVKISGLAYNAFYYDFSKGANNRNFNKGINKTSKASLGITFKIK